MENVNRNNLTIQDINLSLVKQYYPFIDMYYNTALSKTNIKDDFIKYQTEHNYIPIKFGFLSWVYKLGKLKNKYVTPDNELENIFKIKNIVDNSGIMLFNINIDSEEAIYTQILDKLTQYVRDLYSNLDKIEINIQGNLFA